MTTGIDTKWFGAIPSHWKVLKIKYCFAITSGSGFPVNMQGKENGDYPVFKASDISANNFRSAKKSANYITKQESKNFKILPKGTIIFPKIGEALKKNNRAILAVDACLDNNCQGLTPINTDEKYSLYLLSCINMNWFDNSCTVPCINNTTLKNCFIPFPPKYEQSAIANFLDAKCAEIDALTADIKKQIETLQEYKKSVIIEAIAKGLDLNVEMKDSGIQWIGLMPNDWEISRIKYGCIKIGSGKTPKGGAEKYTNEGIIFLRSQNIYDTGLVLDEVAFITKEIHHEMSSSAVKQNDVLLNITGGSIGRCCIVPENFPEANVNQHVCIIRSNKYAPKWIKYFWNSSCGQFSISRLQGSANREALNFEEIGNAFLPIPPIDIQKRIISYLDNKTKEIDKTIQAKSNQLDLLQKYKQSLIFEYVTGKKTVPNA